MTPQEIVNAWFGERLANGPLARDTEAYNQVYAALPDLVSRLTPAAPAPIPAPPPPAPAVLKPAVDPAPEA
jgi:hypothetical protein